MNSTRRKNDAMEFDDNNNNNNNDDDPPHSQKNAQIPPWMIQEQVSFQEKIEIKLFQLISIFPVFVTFGLYTYFIVFYVGVSFSIYLIIAHAL